MSDLPERILDASEFLAALGVSGNEVEMAHRTRALMGHDRALRAENAQLRADLAALEPLARLGERALLASREGCHYDGGDIQRDALDYRVTEHIVMEAPCDGDFCRCLFDGADFPAGCYRDTPATATARAVLDRLAKEGA